MGSSRSRPCPRSMNCAPRLLASSRRRRRNSRSLPLRRLRNSPALFALTQTRTRRPEASSALLVTCHNQYQTNIKGLRLMANLEKIVEDLSSLTVLEAAELAKLLESKWG